MSGVTPEEREKALAATDPNIIGSCDCGNVGHADALDALISAGWGPGGAPVRPTPEARAAVAKIIDEHVDMPLSSQLVLADALLAADHLWAEEPTVEDVSEMVKTAIAQQMLVPVGAPVVDREALARAYDPDAFDENVKKSSHPVAEIQWAARRKLADDAAGRALASGLFVDRVTVEATAIARELDRLADADVYLTPGDLREFAKAYRAGERS